MDITVRPSHLSGPCGVMHYSNDTGPVWAYSRALPTRSVWELISATVCSVMHLSAGYIIDRLQRAMKTATCLIMVSARSQTKDGVEGKGKGFTCTEAFFTSASQTGDLWAFVTVVRQVSIPTLVHNSLKSAVIIQSASVLGAFLLCFVFLCVCCVSLTLLYVHDADCLRTRGNQHGDTLGGAQLFGLSAGFLTFARLVVPLRIALALALTPAMDKYVVKGFLKKGDETEEVGIDAAEV